MEYEHFIDRMYYNFNAVVLVAAFEFTVILNQSLFYAGFEIIFLNWSQWISQTMSAHMHIKQQTLWLLRNCLLFKSTVASVLYGLFVVGTVHSHCINSTWFKHIFSTQKSLKT